MRTKTVWRAVLVLAGLTQGADAAARQQAGAQARQVPEAVHAHIRHLAEAFDGTPNGQGLVPTARAEAEIVVRHAALAAADPTNLDAIKLHVGHVLHAVDPTAMPSGPGLGYGLKQAAQGIAQHAETIWDTAEAPRPVRMHAEHVTVSGRNTLQRADSIAILARRILEATTAQQASSLVNDLKTLADQLIPGVDANRDNGIGWRRGEGGLEVVRQHLNVLRREAGVGS
jgi:hypothetical protein